MAEQVTFRVSAEDSARLESVTKHCGIDRANLLRALVLAFCDTVEREGQIRMPLAVVSAPEMQTHPIAHRDARLRFLEVGLLAAGLVGFVGLRLAGRRKAAICTILAARSIAAVASTIHSVMLRRGMSTDLAGEPRMVAGESPEQRTIPRMKQSDAPANSPKRRAAR